MSDERSDRTDREDADARRHPAQRWEPLRAGEVDQEATSFVQLPEGFTTGPTRRDHPGPGDRRGYGEGAPYGDPLAAPGHGYVPPSSFPAGPADVAPHTPEPGADPGTTGQWTMPFAGGGAPEYAQYGTVDQGYWGGPQAPAGDDGGTGQWSVPTAPEEGFEDSGGYALGYHDTGAPGGYPAAHPHPHAYPDPGVAPEAAGQGAPGHPGAADGGWPAAGGGQDQFTGHWDASAYTDVQGGGAHPGADYGYGAPGGEQSGQGAESYAADPLTDGGPAHGPEDPAHSGHWDLPGQSPESWRDGHDTGRPGTEGLAPHHLPQGDGYPGHPGGGDPYAGDPYDAHHAGPAAGDAYGADPDYGADPHYGGGEPHYGHRPDQGAGAWGDTTEGAAYGTPPADDAAARPAVDNTAGAEEVQAAPAAGLPGGAGESWPASDVAAADPATGHQAFTGDPAGPVGEAPAQAQGYAPADGAPEARPEDAAHPAPGHDTAGHPAPGDPSGTAPAAGPGVAPAALGSAGLPHARRPADEFLAGTSEPPAPSEQGAAEDRPAATPDAAEHAVPAPRPGADGLLPHGAGAEPGAPAPESADDGAPRPGAGAADLPDQTVEHPSTSYVLTVNGVDRPVTDAWIGESLLYVLRERLGLAGAKDGCSQGECGACSVQVDGRLVASCLVPAATTAGSEVRTVEGLARGGEPSDVQRALVECGAVQCGFCIPGMAMTLHDLLEGNHAPSELEARKALSGNLCRCSGYRGVLDAAREVARARAAAYEEAHADPSGSEPARQSGPDQPHPDPQPGESA